MKKEYSKIQEKLKIGWRGLLYVFFIILTSQTYGVIIIDNIEELQKIGNDPSYPLDGEYELIQDIDASDTMNWNNGAGFEPIGKTFANPFVGKLNGNGKKIINLHIHRPSQDCIGLFGYMNGEVKNLALKNVDIIGHDYVGGISGKTSFSTVNSCYVTGSISGTMYVGGLIGVTSRCALSQCFTMGTVSGTWNVGGLIGSNGDPEDQASTTWECYSIADVYGTGCHVGGFVGMNLGLLENCYATGAVTGADEVGGFVGLNAGAIKTCYSTGWVTGAGIVGGFVGDSYYNMEEKSYWDINTSGWDTSQGGEGRTTSQMQKQETYVNWNFLATWTILENESYPYFSWQRGPLVLCPDITGISKNDAEVIILEKGLTTGTVSWNCSDIFPVDYVISQYPMEGQQVPWNGEVDYIISCGYCITVPDVIGVELQQAIDLIIENKLILGDILEICDNTYPIGYVVLQSPLAIQNTCVIPNTTTIPVDLWVSTGLCEEGEGISEGVPEGEGISEGEGSVEGTPEGIEGEGSVEGTTEGVTEGIVEGTPEGIEGEGSVEGTTEGVTEGIVEGIVEGTGEGEGIMEGIEEGVSEGIVEGTLEGTSEGEGIIEGEGIAEGEGNIEGMVEGEGVIEGIVEGILEGEPEGIIEGNHEGIFEGLLEGEGIIEGSPEGEGTSEGIQEGEGIIEGTSEGEGTVEGEGITEGSAEAEGAQEGEGAVEGEGEKPPHSADPNGDWKIVLSELLRVIQFFNFGGYHCEAGTEDGYAPGYDGDKTCTPHGSDYNTQDWMIDLSELLRLIQFFNMGGYHPCPDGEDGYCPG